MNARELRTETGLTLARISYLYGITPDAWVKRESGQRKSPDFPESAIDMTLLAHSLDITIADLTERALQIYLYREEIVRCPECKTPVDDLAFVNVENEEDIQRVCPQCKASF